MGVDVLHKSSYEPPVLVWAPLGCGSYARTELADGIRHVLEYNIESLLELLFELRLNAGQKADVVDRLHLQNKASGEVTE